MNKIRTFNEWLAAHATLVFGSMWMTYAFCLYGFIPVIWPSAMNTLLYWSNTVQLWSLPLLMVGQNVLGRAAERRAIETHDAVMEELGLLRDAHDGLTELVSSKATIPASAGGGS
jgi:hypothetical protein